jgi:hypothetical protein
VASDIAPVARARRNRGWRAPASARVPGSWLRLLCVPLIALAWLALGVVLA